MRRQPTTTAKDMMASGEWAKTGKKSYTHVSGLVISYDHNRFLWVINGDRNKSSKALWLARMEAEAMIVKAS